jgi:colanic acid biosynthesis glycosyl transferase WcaI
MNLPIAPKSNAPQKILVLSQYFEPEPNVVVSLVAKHLANECEDKYHVTVICALPNYPLNRFYEGWASLWPKKQNLKNQTIIRLPMWPSHSRNPAFRMVSYLTFLFVCFFSAPFLCLNPKVILVYQTPFFTGISALFFKWVYKAKLIFVNVDLWPESLLATEVAKPNPLLSLLFFYSRWINRQAHQIICSTQGMLQRFKNDGIPHERLMFLPVCVEGIPDADKLKSLSWQPSSPESLQVVYAGNMGPAQALDVVMHCAALCAQEDLKIQFCLYGYGSEKNHLTQLASQLHVLDKNVFIYPQIPPEEAFQKQFLADVVLVHLKDSPLFRMTLPSKLATAFAAGGIVLCGAQGETRSWCESSGGAVVFDPESADEMFSAIKKISSLTLIERQDRRKKALDFYSQNLSKEVVLGRYESIILQNLA